MNRVPDFVRNGTAPAQVPAADTLAALCEQVADAGYFVQLSRHQGSWKARVRREGDPIVFWSVKDQGATPASALRGAIARLRKESVQ